MIATKDNMEDIIENLIPVSFNGFSTDLQIQDALEFIEFEYPDVWQQIGDEFPEIMELQFDGSWMNTDSMDVDPEWPNWLADRLEDTGLVFWEEGEPWGFINEEHGELIGPL